MQKIDVDKIRSNLKYGDNQKIKQITGLSLSFISAVLHGKKNSDDVLEAAARIGAANIARKEAIKNIITHDALVIKPFSVDGEAVKNNTTHDGEALKKITLDGKSTMI